VFFASLVGHERKADSNFYLSQIASTMGDFLTFANRLRLLGSGVMAKNCGTGGIRSYDGRLFPSAVDANETANWHQPCLLLAPFHRSRHAETSAATERLHLYSRIGAQPAGSTQTAHLARFHCWSSRFQFSFYHVGEVDVVWSPLDW